MVTPLKINLEYTPRKFNSSPLKIGNPKRKLIFQPSFFRGYVKFRGCRCFVSVHVRRVFFFLGGNSKNTYIMIIMSFVSFVFVCFLYWFLKLGERYIESNCKWLKRSIAVRKITWSWFHFPTCFLCLSLQWQANGKGSPNYLKGYESSFWRHSHVSVMTMGRRGTVKHIHILVNQMHGVSSTYILWVIQRVDVGYNKYNLYIST